MQKNHQRGFTLIELLVVIAIIGILASIVLASLDSARKKGRDARRIADIKQLQLALELYYDANGVFPPALTTANIVTPGYISVIPSDPSTTTGCTTGAEAGCYAYAPTAVSGAAGTCTGYHLGANLETSGSTALGSDADKTTLTISGTETNISGMVQCTATGYTADFHGADASKCSATGGTAGGYCYDVTN
jgi:prepilin-type N-terminal cleavage/methylation domain-containing protein